MSPNGVSNRLSQPFIQVQIKENIKAPRHWPLCGEFTGDRWLPPHKGPITRKMFPFDDVIMNISAVGSVDEWITCWDDVFSCFETIWYSIQLVRHAPDDIFGNSILIPYPPCKIAVIQFGTRFPSMKYCLGSQCMDHIRSAFLSHPIAVTS